MTKKKKAEEVIPDVIRRLSNNEAISTSDISKEYNVSESSFKERLKDVRETFYEHFFEPDKGTGKWVRTEPSFLEKMLLTPEETVVLTGILRNRKSFGEKLAPWVDIIVDNYVKRTKTSVFKQDVLEKIDDDLEIVFARLKYAIEEKRKIKFKNNDGYIVMYPYKIINLEYYWYILGYEDYSEYWIEIKKKPEMTNKVKTFTIANIRDLEILDDTYKYDFYKTEKELKNAMNAFFSVDDGSETIELLVVNWLEDYIKRAPYFSGWRKTDEYELIKDEKYDKDIKYIVYEIKSSNKYYQDVIPTILKYIPHIRVRNDEKLATQIFDEIKKFANAHNRRIEDIV
ncbi:WYL domain-containing protein [Sulfurimonas sp.]|uniref:helix-turn-helix transcriptional regulator n=1 Tax=Sulfurimonas sp. TaxID=2022749 RepID=UPI0026149390|nr:WYL domain-containing protein [Sulfurimonas sp.]MDD5156827.1 WYL domain-containing protein [Sulfurimonas sp.]